MKVFKITFIASFVLALAITCATAFSSAQIIEENILRIHIRANGNSKAEQEIKLQVRDSIIDASKGLFADSKSTEESILIAMENLEYLKAVADETLEEAGVEYRASVRIADEYFPTKHYKDISLPSGVYTALVIELGSGEGENWWCMLYPALCPYGEDVFQGERTKEELIELIGSENYKMITSKRPTVKFKIMELWGKLRLLMSTK